MNGNGKVKQCCDSCGIDYTSELDSRDFENKNVRVELEMESSTQYGDKNVVKKYLLRQTTPTVTRVADDDIPF